MTKPVFEVSLSFIKRPFQFNLACVNKRALSVNQETHQRVASCSAATSAAAAVSASAAAAGELPEWR
jgi:hypothetical protein